MDTVRSLYIDSANAKERNGSYVYDLVGGIAVPEGARVFIDNVSFTNTFSEEVSEENQYAYLQTFESDSVTDLSDESCFSHTRVRLRRICCIQIKWW